MSSQDLKRHTIVTSETQALYDAYRFPQATRVGNMVWVTGQVGIDANVVPGKDIIEQSHLAFQNLRAALEAAGATMADVVEIMTFHTDLIAEQHMFNSVKDEYFPDRYPSWTGVGVSQLALPELRVEIRAVAVIGCGAA